MTIKNFVPILSALLLATSLGAGSARAVGLSLSEAGIEIDNGTDAKFLLSYPVLVDSGKKDIKIQEKTVTGKAAVLRFLPAGQIDVELGEGKVIYKLSQIPEGTKFLSETIKIGTEYGNGGKWKAGGAETPFPATKGAQNIFSGNSKSLVLTSTSGTKTSFVIPQSSFQQIQDGREWNLNYFLWKAWMDLAPGTDSYVIEVGGNDIAAAVPPPAPAASAPPAPIPPVAAQKPGDNVSDTIVLKWKDGKRAVFYMAFDDSCPSHIKNVIPELTKRKMPGTFYVVTGGGVHNNLQADWERASSNPYVVLANHTLNHKGVENAEQLDLEISKCNEQIHAYYPNRKTPRLISFGTPGGVPWKVTKEEFNQALEKYHLINRPSFFGPPFHQKSSAEMIAVLDGAIKKGEMGHLDFHGVGGDWHITPMEWFVALLDRLEAHRDQVWITDPVSWHQYLTERKTAEVKVVKSEPKEIRLLLSSQADPEFYDLPLTLATRIPPDWRGCTVIQGPVQSRAVLVDGVAKYDALPGAEEIVLRGE